MGSTGKEAGENNSIEDKYLRNENDAKRRVFDPTVDVEKEVPSQAPADATCENRKVDFDSIIEDLDDLGPFQRRLMALCAVVAVFAAWSASEYLFTTARIPTRCLIPECDGAEPEWSPAWLPAAVPGAASGAPDNCQRFAPLADTAADTGNCPASLFNQSSLQTCEQYVYENTNSIVYDFGLACDEWRRTLIGSMRTLGALLALPISGFISDRWGRRTALVMHAINGTWLGVVRYWASSYVGFMISQVVESIFGTGIYTSAYILLLEVFSPKRRIAAAATMMSSWAVGQMSLGLIAWGVPQWQNLTLTLYIPQFISIFFYWLATESARWYLSKGRYADSEAVIQKIARVNGKTLDPKSLEYLRRTAEEDMQRRELMREQKTTEPWLVVSVFRHKRVLLRCVVAPVWWVSNTFIYYGLSINAVNMVGNRYLNYVAVSAVEIPGFWTAAFLLNKWGRKPVMITAFWMCACCQLAYIFIPSDWSWLSLAVYLVGKYAIALVSSSLYIYTAELFPTRHRHSLFAFTSMVGRIGSILAPLTPAFGASTFEEFPFVLFGSLALLSGCLIFLAPETRGTKLPDTMEQADKL